MAKQISDAIDEFNQALSQRRLRKRKPRGLLLFSGIDTDALQAAFDSAESGANWAYPRVSVVSSGPVEIKRIRLRPFQTKRRVCKVRIPVQKDGRSIWPQQ